MKLRTLFLGSAAAAAVTYLFDPQQGVGRRSRLRDQLMARLRDVKSESERRQRHAANLAQGVVSTMRSRADEIRERAATATSVTEDVEAGDEVVSDRVQSEVLGRPDVPKDRIVVNVEDGIVVLRGELESQEQIDGVLEKVGAVKGVRAIDSLLHVRGTPPPNKQEALDASARASTSTPASGTAIE